MRIAIPYENKEIYQHFGRTPAFKVYDVENNEIVKSVVYAADEQGHMALGTQLKELEINVVICGGVGDRMVSILKENGMEVYANVTVSPDEAVLNYLSGKLEYLEEYHKCHGDHHH